MTIPRFPITFPAGRVALAVRADPGTDLGAALRAMGLTTGVPTIVLVGAGTAPVPGPTPRAAAGEGGGPRR